MKTKLNIAVTLAAIMALLFNSLALAYVVTDQQDYQPGGVVTISGGNADGAGYAAGETVRVVATAPDSSSISCDAIADDAGSWSCELALASDAPIGDWSYTATGLTSNVSQGGSFTVSAPVPPPTAGPTIASDLADYNPGQLVTLTGANWQGDTTVTITVVDAVPTVYHDTDQVQVQADGTISDSFNLPDTFVDQYFVTATGAQTGRVATTTFTDALNTISPTSGPEGVGFTLTLNRSGTGGNYTASTRVTFGSHTGIVPSTVTVNQLTVAIPGTWIPEEGTQSVSTTSPSGGPLTFTVTEGDVFHLTGVPINASAGSAFSGNVATMVDDYDNTTLTGVSATIAWGDGSSSAGTVTRTGVGTYNVSGSHTYGLFLQTSMRLTTTLPAATLPIANNGTTPFASSGTLVVRTSDGYQTVTYTGKTTGTNTTTFTGVSGGTGTALAGNSVVQSFAPASVTVTEASPGNATASVSGIPVTVTDPNVYTGSNSTYTIYSEGARFGGSNFAQAPGSIAFSGSASSGNYRMKSVTDLGDTAWWQVDGNGVNSFFTFSAGSTPPLPSMTFPEEGTHTFTEYLYRNDGTIAGTTGGTLILGDAQLGYYFAVNSYNAVEGSSTGDIQIGNFLDYNPNGDPSDFRITIHWGDGSPDSVGYFAVAAGLNGSNQATFKFSAAHTYAEEGTYHATYDVLDDGGSSLTGISTATVVVSDPSVAVTGAALSTQYGTSFASNDLATFTDPGGAEANDGTHYSAAVNWGGSFGSAAGTISFSAGTFTVTAAIPYTAVGSYSPIVTITHEASTPQSVTDTVSIAKADQTITFLPLANKTWGDADVTVSATASSDLTVTFTASGNCSVSGNSVHITGAGSCTVTAHQAGDGNYNAAPDVSRSFTIAKAVLTVTADDKTKLLNAPNPPLTYTITGFVNGDTMAVVSGSADCSTTATTTSGVGSYPITCTLNTLAADNYSFTFQAGTLKIIFNFTGFFQPVDNLPTLNVVKAGQAIPVKFSLSGNQGLGIMAAGYPVATVTVCGNTTTDVIEQTVTAGSSSLSYDATTDQYIYVWKTDKAWGGSCRTLTVKFVDGTIHQANFQLTK